MYNAHKHTLASKKFYNKETCLNLFCCIWNLLEQKISVNDLSFIISDLENILNFHCFLTFRLLILCGFFFWGGLYLVSAGFLVPQPGIELVPSAVKAQSPNHWKASKFPDVDSEWSLRFIQLPVDSLPVHWFHSVCHSHFYLYFFVLQNHCRWWLQPWN